MKAKEAAGGDKPKEVKKPPPPKKDPSQMTMAEQLAAQREAMKEKELSRSQTSVKPVDNSLMKSTVDRLGTIKESEEMEAEPLENSMIIPKSQTEPPKIAPKVEAKKPVFALKKEANFKKSVTSVDSSIRDQRRMTNMDALAAQIGQRFQDINKNKYANDDSDENESSDESEDESD